MLSIYHTTLVTSDSRKPNLSALDQTDKPQTKELWNEEVEHIPSFSMSPRLYENHLIQNILCPNP